MIDMKEIFDLEEEIENEKGIDDEVNNNVDVGKRRVIVYLDYEHEHDGSEASSFFSLNLNPNLFLTFFLRYRILGIFQKLIQHLAYFQTLQNHNPYSDQFVS